MADAEEPQFSTLAERIAALNKQKNFSAPEPVRKRPPPPPPPDRTQSLPAVPSSVNPPIQPSPAIPPRPKRSNVPIIQNDANEAPHQPSQGAPPPLPNRTTSSQTVPTLPPRRCLTQPPSLMVRRNSGSSEISQHSTLSSISVGHTASSVTSQGSEGTIYKLPPAYDPASLPALPPTKREREAKQAEEAAKSQPKRQITPARPVPAVRQTEPAPAPKPGLPPRIPSRPAKPQQTATAVTPEPTQPPRKLPPRPAAYVKPPVTNETPAQQVRLQKTVQLPTPPPDVPPLPGRRPSSNPAPPPVPVASRPTFAQIEAVSTRSVAPSSRVVECWVCHDWSGPDGVAAQFPRQSLPRNDPVGHLARGLCDPFPSYTDKARAIFTWFHHNITYDTVSFFGNCVKHMSVEDTIFSGLAVCQGYAETYKAIANRAGLECVLVTGHGKGFGYNALKEGERPPPPDPTGHAWNAVRIDGGEWKLLDACWGAGHLDTNTNQYKQKFTSEEFTRSNDKFGRSHFPRDSKYQFRNDQRILSWDEYYIGEFVGEKPTFYTNLYTEGISPESVEPKHKNISVYSNEVVRFQFSKICEHWTSETHGEGKPPLLLLSIHGVDGRKDEMVPMETNGYWHWIDVNARDLGAPGQAVQVAQLTSIDGQDARGVTAQEFLSKKGKVGMAWGYVMRWELV